MKGVAVAADVATIVTTKVVATTEDEGRYFEVKTRYQISSFGVVNRNTLGIPMTSASFSNETTWGGMLKG